MLLSATKQPPNQSTYAASGHPIKYAGPPTSKRRIGERAKEYRAGSPNGQELGGDAGVEQWYVALPQFLSLVEHHALVSRMSVLANRFPVSVSKLLSNTDSSFSRGA